MSVRMPGTATCPHAGITTMHLASCNQTMDPILWKIPCYIRKVHIHLVHLSYSLQPNLILCLTIHFVSKQYTRMFHLLAYITLRDLVDSIFYTALFQPMTLQMVNYKLLKLELTMCLRMNGGTIMNYERIAGCFFYRCAHLQKCCLI